ncbi:MAG: hypothetical protein JO093_02415 [Acidobacteria bacterium]|nr:hypothetical protein [Acidobacteriota bacterium]MBV9067561.1 hypothetical protein [Acidobacteriota bacterium]MBV9184439.1 hypothetical protein [Acidobacteriota bacterium]
MNSPRPPTADPRLPVSLILLLFAAARIPLLIVREPFFDELFTRWISAKPFAGIVSALRWDSGPPLFYFVVRLLGDPSVTMTRILSLVCAAISLIVILRTKNMIAALLLAVFPPAVLFAADARAYAMCAMFVTIAVLAIDDDRPFAAALALLAAAYSHYYAVLLFPILLLKNRSAGGPPAGPPAARRRVYALAGAIILYIPGFVLALRQPTEARAWMTANWPDALFVAPPIAIAIIGATAFAMSIRVNRYALMVLIPLLFAIATRVYVPLRFEAVIAAPLVLWLAESLKTNRFRVPLTAALVTVCAVWTTLGIADHATRPPDSYRQAAAWVAANIPAAEPVVATGYCYLETIMNGHTRVVAFPDEQAIHPGWRAIPKPGLHSPAGAFFWTGERAAPELGVFQRDRRIIEPLFINDRAMVALVR